MGRVGRLWPVAESAVAESAARQEHAAKLPSCPEPVAPDRIETLQMASFRAPVSDLSDSPGPGLERSGPMPEMRDLPGEERAALPALGLRGHRRGRSCCREKPGLSAARNTRPRGGC